MLDYLLRKIGLCRIAKAKGLALCIHKHCINKVQRWVKEDFGAVDSPEYVEAVEDAKFEKVFDICLRGSGSSNYVEIEEA